ncbi:TetR family transcriptional regulator, partial [Actinomadura adrarensis]
DGEEGAAERLRKERLALESLPPGRYPHLSAVAGGLERLPDLTGYYSFGIDLLLSAVEAKAPH